LNLILAACPRVGFPDWRVDREEEDWNATKRMRCWAQSRSSGPRSRTRRRRSVSRGWPGST